MGTSRNLGLGLVSPLKRWGGLGEERRSLPPRFK
jgi:hypothetical protein